MPLERLNTLFKQKKLKRNEELKVESRGKYSAI